MASRGAGLGRAASGQLVLRGSADQPHCTGAVQPAGAGLCRRGRGAGRWAGAGAGRSRRILACGYLSMLVMAALTTCTEWKRIQASAVKVAGIYTSRFTWPPICPLRWWPVCAGWSGPRWPTPRREPEPAGRGLTCTIRKAPPCFSTGRGFVEKSAVQPLVQGFLQLGQQLAVAQILHGGEGLHQTGRAEQPGVQNAGLQKVPAGPPARPASGAGPAGPPPVVRPPQGPHRPDCG